MLATAVSAYNAKLQRGLGLAFSAHFLHDFSTNMFLTWYSYNGENFNVTTYFFLKTSNKCVILSSYLYSWLHHKLLRFFLDQLQKQWLTGRKRGEDENTKTWISRERKELFRWNNSYFLKGYHLVINKNLIKNSGRKLKILKMVTNLGYFM